MTASNPWYLDNVHWSDMVILFTLQVAVENLQSSGRMFMAYINENGVLPIWIVLLVIMICEQNLIVGISTQTEAEDPITMEQEKSTLIFLPPQIFMDFETQVNVGLFFSVYESSKLFPLAENSNPNDAIGSPVVGASVAENLDVFEENVIIMVPLNDSVSLACVPNYNNVAANKLLCAFIFAFIRGLHIHGVCHGILVVQVHRIESAISSCDKINIHINMVGGRGNWTTHGCETSRVNDDMVKCSCNHLTNFACLVVSIPLTL